MSGDKPTAPQDKHRTKTNPERGPDRRRNVVDLRSALSGFERRRGPGRRRSDFMKSADEGELSQEQFLFVLAIDAYKRANDRPYPTWTEVIEVIRKLGYRKTCSMQVQLDGCEDWTEAPDTPAAAASKPIQLKPLDASQPV